MKQIFSTVCMMLLCAAGISAQSKSANKKVLIVYYSLSGITEKTAENIRKITGGDIYEIETVKAYPAGSRQVSEQAKKEIASGNLPEIKQNFPALSGYDAILIGGPVWSGNLAAPLIAYMQHESGKLNGKITAPFWTDAGTAGNYEKEFQGRAGNAAVKQGLGLTYASSIPENELNDRITSWLKNIGIL